MSHIQTGQVPHTDRSCPTYRQVMSHIQTGQVPHTGRSSPTYRQVMSHIQTGQVPHTGRSSPTYRQVMSHIQTGQVPHTGRSSPTQTGIQTGYVLHTESAKLMVTKCNGVIHRLLTFCVSQPSQCCISWQSREVAVLE